MGSVTAGGRGPPRPPAGERDAKAVARAATEADMLLFVVHCLPGEVQALGCVEAARVAVRGYQNGLDRVALADVGADQLQVFGGVAQPGHLDRTAPAGQFVDGTGQQPPVLLTEAFPWARFSGRKGPRSRARGSRKRPSVVFAETGSLLTAECRGEKLQR